MYFNCVYLVSILYILYILSDINWKILHANILQHAERKYIEAFEIQNRGEKIINGSVGRIISALMD